MLENDDKGEIKMRFKAYDICSLSDNSMILEETSDKLFNTLNLFPRINDGSESYAPLYMSEEEDYLFGTLAQSHPAVLTSFTGDNNNKKEKAIDANQINDKTYFYIDKIESRIYVQGKLYPPTLSPTLTVDRLSNILSTCYDKIIRLIPAKIEYTNEQIREIFSTSYVKTIIFNNLLGLKIKPGTQLHNPRIDLDESLAETWNTYDSINYMELRAKDEEKLNKNPIAKIGMELAIQNEKVSVFKKMEVYDSGQKVEIKPTGNENKIIYVPRQCIDDPYETYDRIKKKIIN